MNGIYGVGFIRTILKQTEMSDQRTRRCTPGQKYRRYTFAVMNPTCLLGLLQKYHHQRVTESEAEEILDVMCQTHLTFEYIPSTSS